MWFWGSYQVRVPSDPAERCCDGTPPSYLTCGGIETTAPEPYLFKVFGDNKPVIMCGTHRENSQRDADEALISERTIWTPAK